MAGEIVYADLKVPSESEPTFARTFHSSPQLYAFQRPHWQKITLWIACTGNIILLVALIILSLQLEVKTEKGGMTMECNASSDSTFQSHLRSKLCNQSQGISSVNSTCQVCPAYWVLHRDKCYWFQSKNPLKTWNNSRDDCLARKSQLLVIQDMEDMDFVTENITNVHYTYWIGFSLSLPMKNWIWVTGSQVSKSLFQEQKHEEDKHCGAIKNKKIISEPCSSILRWICQKDPVLI
ncbi:killer cell lectin-like receptor subfamily F member 1 isoform X1 [Sceloporus undulatus]|uniref:killer cell lectin-like receptor subfamily F member 1 isoform X1 n=1 Tax=Sceloporus undulatus TaxID=8520 RepID=UPI001C4CE580|nr:killer cell lectin-like receptor subfamily F member 1 isoform X1 [Sceloporus undulatus]